jgi:hypothetical protein
MDVHPRLRSRDEFLEGVHCNWLVKMHYSASSREKAPFKWKYGQLELGLLVILL